jgi:hypothetical protein
VNVVTPLGWPGTAGEWAESAKLARSNGAALSYILPGLRAEWHPDGTLIRVSVQHPGGSRKTRLRRLRQTAIMSLALVILCIVVFRFGYGTSVALLAATAVLYAPLAIAELRRRPHRDLPNDLAGPLLQEYVDIATALLPGTSDHPASALRTWAEAQEVLWMLTEPGLPRERRDHLVALHAEKRAGVLQAVEMVSPAT